jgi:hypothetical protein
MPPAPPAPLDELPALLDELLVLDELDEEVEEPNWHAWLHMPQLEKSVCRSTQEPLQRVFPPGQRHCPPEHTWPKAHAVPQPPQLFGSTSVTTHFPAQRVPAQAGSGMRGAIRLCSIFTSGMAAPSSTGCIKVR